MYFDSDNSFTIYNTLTGKLINIENSSSDKFKNLLNKMPVKKEVFDKLSYYGMITDLDKEAEIALCDSLFYTNVYNHQLSITLITTRNCNFRCQYCAQEHSNHSMNQNIYNSIKNFIIKNISKYTTIKITLFGGEPTLEYENYSNFLDEINDLCKFYKRRFEGVIISNGYLLDDKLLHLLYSKNITQYQITLDGSPENHDKCRYLLDHQGTHNKIYKNLINILNNKNLKRLRVAIRINATKELLEDIDSWYELYEPFATDPRFLINLGVVQNRGGEYIKDFKNSLISETDRLYYLAKEKLSHHTFYEDFLRPNYFVCKDISASSFTFDYDGSIRACSNIYADNVIGLLDSHGNIIFNNKYKNFKTKSNLQCSGCIVEPLCHGKTCGIKDICDKNNIILTAKEFVEKQKQNLETIAI